jgi:hypothetical protein
MATLGKHVILWGNWGASAQVANTPLDQYEKAPPISTSRKLQIVLGIVFKRNGD